MTKFFDIKPPRPKPKISKPASVVKRSRKSSSGTFLLVIIILLVCVIYFSANNNNQTNYKQENAPTVEETDNPLDDFAATTLETPTPTPTPSASVAAAETNTSDAIDYSNIKISVLNGAGVPGLATKIKSLLEENGYKVSEVGNAQNAYQETIIYCTAKNQPFADKIKVILKDYQVQITENDTLATDESILVVMGAK